MIQTYNGPLRQGTPVVPSGNCSKAKSNCIFRCLLSFQCHLKFFVRRLHPMGEYMWKVKPVRPSPAAAPVSDCTWGSRSLGTGSSACDPGSTFSFSSHSFVKIDHKILSSMNINLQPGNKAMVSTACTFRFASAFSTSAVHQGRGHISAAQRLLSVFHCGKRKMSCVFSSGSQGRLRGCHRDPPPNISVAAAASLPASLPPDWMLSPPTAVPPTTTTNTNLRLTSLRLQLAFRAGSDYQKTKLIPELNQQLSCFICLYSVLSQESDIISSDSSD